ncbi:sel1 repeat family protein [Leucothrix sargassi]|nr:sel1 repeat family protein [Leucothrix sargassi]
MSFFSKIAAITALIVALSSSAWADVEKGRQLMEQSKFTEAMQEFLPLAQAGNADAEELIGVMYAMGLGVKKDDRRAFEWYMRASMKAHPGAQSGIAWHYEVGRGVEVDLVRAYMWYVLSAIGGDPDAAISQEEVIKKMTPEQVKEAQILIEDYKPHLYPFD